MRIDILSIFPSMFDGFLNNSIIKRAREKGLVEINVINFRDYSTDPHHKVDDYSFGGGQGMVLKPQPIFDAVASLKDTDTTVILLTPQGNKYNEHYAEELANKKHLILICGHYEGFDERIRTLADIELSIGDYILTGGELPSMVITDSVTRLIPGVITDESHIEESFNNNMLDYPVYTQPADYNGMKVPDVLLSGDHAKIDTWRRNEQIKRTKERRPDLIEKS